MNAPLTNAANQMLACVLTLASVIVNANTLERVQTGQSITLGFLPDFAPFSTQDGDKASGYGIDLCLKVVEKVKNELGLPSLQVRYQPLKINEEVDAISTGKVDIVCTPTLATLERRKTVNFTIPIYTAGLSVVVRKNAPAGLLKVLNGQVDKTGPAWRASVNRGLANMTYATVAGSVIDQWVRDQLRALGVTVTRVTVEGANAGLKLVANGKADAFFAERMVLTHILGNTYPDKNLVLLDRIFDYSPTAMMVERDDERFRLLVDTALSEMYRSGEIEQAYDRHLGGVSDTTRKLFKLYALP
ncbi:amino acid ABC transporter substrate-binding protein [Pseudomonas sp. Irchel s3h14]|uniref:amino acid ABC transporter substrate-binding protein n=1 Tax=Pseudomonas sp. Irchel s3h14 TaxID=2009179 RepID=UPI000BA2E699